MKKEFGEYYLGLDIGTDSVGWAVTDLEYNLQKFHGKEMWGIRLFDIGKTAEDRRGFRCARRRLQRRVQRIKLLQEIFAEEISKVDMGFYQRLEDSKLYQEDKRVQQKNTLFCDAAFQDKDYHQKYPTIFHLRKALIKGVPEAFDVRLVYLAIAHILKNRGHFLFEGQQISNVESFEAAFDPLNTYLQDTFGFALPDNEKENIKSVLKDNTLGINDKDKYLCKLFDAKTKQMKAIVKSLCGAKFDVTEALNLPEECSIEKAKISFKDSDYEENRNQILDTLGDLEKVECLDRLKSVFDWALLSTIKKGEQYISYAKVAAYEKHKVDIRILKQVLKKYYDKKTYYDMFSNPGIKTNYVAYVGMTKKNKKKEIVTVKKCTNEEYAKYVKTLLVANKQDPVVKAIIDDCENGTFAPKQIIRDNGVLPYQMHKIELDKILENAARYLPFLNCKDETGYTAAEKIVKILMFRIPYYVGPLNDAHISADGEKGNCWMVKKQAGKIRPWNFDEMVDKEQSAERFIRRMTNKCTYVVGEDVLPKDSLLYSKFTLLNELNNVCVNGERLPADLKQHIYRELFMYRKKVTAKAFRDFLVNNGYIDESTILSGFDGDFKNSLGSYYDFEKVIGTRVNNTEMVENIIKWIVLFGESKDLLKNRIEKYYGQTLSEMEIKKILQLKYAGWGRLSSKFLLDFTSELPGFSDELNIITALYETQNNLMELLSNKNDYISKVNDYNLQETKELTVLTYDVVRDMYVSPAVKRSVWQSLLLVEEIRGIMGSEPNKVFIEVTRSDEKDKKRTISRKNALIGLYKKCKEETRDWVAELEHRTDGDLRGDKLYLYYTQMGQCMYTGERIRLEELFSTGKDGKAIYDIEHIYPQSKTKDDSIDNRVLVKAEANRAKGDNYPVPQAIRNKCSKLWQILLDKGFISRKKYERLVRAVPFSADELAGFIARQIVETSQSTKAVAELLSRAYKNSGIVYVKAGNVSRFRQQFGFVKCRAINDYHHAKDAYLNIVVGNVYDTKFTRNPLTFIKTGTPKYSLNRMYDFSVQRNGNKAWEPGENGSISTVKRVMKSNRVLFTRYAVTVKGGLFDQMPVKKGHGQVPLKQSLSNPLSDIEKYGGYNKEVGAYFFLVEHVEKKKRVRSIEYVPIAKSKAFLDNDDALLIYCSKELGLQEARILLKRIKINTLFKIEGFLAHLSGRTSEQLIFKGANQLILSDDNERYIKRVIKFVERNKEMKGNLKVSEFDKLYVTTNIDLFNTLLEKLKTTVFGVKLSAQIKTIEKGLDTYIALSIEEQLLVLYEALHMFQCNSVSSNLKLIKGAGSAGIITLSKTISNCKKLSIIYQSPTGLFEQEIDLLKL